MSRRILKIWQLLIWSRYSLHFMRAKVSHKKKIPRNGPYGKSEKSSSHSRTPIVKLKWTAQCAFTPWDPPTREGKSNNRVHPARLLPFGSRSGELVPFLRPSVLVSEEYSKQARIVGFHTYRIAAIVHTWLLTRLQGQRGRVCLPS
jgi:hypothetical protein